MTTRTPLDLDAILARAASSELSSRNLNDLVDEIRYLRNEVAGAWSIRLAEKMQSSINEYEIKANRSWNGWNAVDAMRWRATADGIRIAKEHHLAAIAETKAEARS